jgi:hypothetical protein
MKKRKVILAMIGTAFFAVLFILGCRSIPMAGTPLVDINDQDTTNWANRIYVEDVVSVGPGWIVLFNQTADGKMGQIIGYAAVHDGVNENVRVNFDVTNATPNMYAILYTASDPAKFDPTKDKAVRNSAGQLVMDMVQLPEYNPGIPNNYSAPTP